MIVPYLREERLLVQTPWMRVQQRDFDVNGETKEYVVVDRRDAVVVLPLTCFFTVEVLMIRVMFRMNLLQVQYIVTGLLPFIRIVLPFPNLHQYVWIPVFQTHLKCCIYHIRKREVMVFCLEGLPMVSPMLHTLSLSVQPNVKEPILNWLR
jgi:hypothetical protein